MEGRFVSLVFLLALVAAAPASAAEDDGFCRNGAFPTENADFDLAVIKGQGRAYLLSDMDGCPNTSLQCRKSAWSQVVPGDRVVIGRAKGDYVCAYFPKRGGGTAGWVDKARIRQLAANSSPPPSSWIGGWSDEGDPTVQISGRGNDLRIAGRAYWPGPKPQKGWPSGRPHSGRINGKLTVVGNRANYDDEVCKIDFVLLADLLIASDNDMCGGMNVHFTAVYRRVRA